MKYKFQIKNKMNIAITQPQCMKCIRTAGEIGTNGDVKQVISRHGLTMYLY